MRPTLPSLPDPFRRVAMPRDLDAVLTVAEEVPAEEGGLTPESTGRIWQSVVDLYRAGVHPAVQFCLRREGQVVLDRCLGHARGNGPGGNGDEPKLAATPATPFCVFSASKAITAMVVHLLDERGALHIGDRVSDYIPEYTSHGKQAITIAQVLSHRASVPSLPREALTPEHAGDREFLVEALCEARPRLRPGRALAYHAVSGGFILGEIVERVAGASIRDVLAEHILDPLGFRWTNYGVEPEDVERVGLNYVTGPPLLPPLSNLVTRALGMPLDQVVEYSNDPRFLSTVVPSGNLVTTAHELSRFFEIFRAGGELDGVRIMQPRTIRRALAEQSHLEIDYSLVFPTRFSLGLMLGAKVVSLFGRDTEHAFGHLGLINIMGWADPERGVSAALITSGKPVLYPELPRFYGVMQRIASEVPKVPREARHV